MGRYRKVAIDFDDPRYLHGCCAYVVHVKKAVVRLAVAYVLLEGISILFHISSDNEVDTILTGFYAASVLCLYKGLNKKDLLAMLLFFALLVTLVLAECITLFLQDYFPRFMFKYGKDIKRENLYQTEEEKIEFKNRFTDMVVFFGINKEDMKHGKDWPMTIIKTVYMALVVFVSVYLFKVILNYRRFIIECKKLPRVGRSKSRIHKGIQCSIVNEDMTGKIKVPRTSKSSLKKIPLEDIPADQEKALAPQGTDKPVKTKKNKGKKDVDGTVKTPKKSKAAKTATKAKGTSKSTTKKDKTKAKEEEINEKTALTSEERAEEYEKEEFDEANEEEQEMLEEVESQDEDEESEEESDETSSDDSDSDSTDDEPLV